MIAGMSMDKLEESAREECDWRAEGQLEIVRQGAPAEIILFFG
jgi:hypothetical protein